MSINCNWRLSCNHLREKNHVFNSIQPVAKEIPSRTVLFFRPWSVQLGGHRALRIATALPGWQHAPSSNIDLVDHFYFYFYFFPQIYYFPNLRYLQQLRGNHYTNNNNWFLQEIFFLGDLIMKEKNCGFFFSIARNWTKRNLLFLTYNLVSGQKQPKYIHVVVEFGIEEAEINFF